MGNEYSKGFENGGLNEKFGCIWGTKGKDHIEIVDGKALELKLIGSIQDLINYIESYNLKSFTTSCEMRHKKVRIFSFDGKRYITMNDYENNYLLHPKDQVFFQPWETDEGTFFVK